MRPPPLRVLLVPIALFGPALFAAGTAHAAEPTTADCLNASDASLKLGNEHKLRAERGQLLICASASCPTDIRKECNRRVDEVSTELPTVVFQVKDASGGDLTAVKVTMDNEVLCERLQGTAISIDPGEHNFTFETVGQPPLTKRLLIQQAQKDRREVILFGAGSQSSRGTVASPPVHGDEGGMGTQKVLAVSAAGVGAVGLVMGVIFGSMALSEKSAAQTACPNATCTTPDGVSKWNSAFSSGTVSTVGFILGGVGLAAGATLWFTAPAANANTQVGVGPGGLQLKGTF